MEERPNQQWIFSLCLSRSPYISQPFASISALLPQRIYTILLRLSCAMRLLLALLVYAWLSQIPMVVTGGWWWLLWIWIGEKRR